MNNFGFASRDNARLEKGVPMKMKSKRVKKRTNHVHQVNLGHAKNEGTSVGLGMLTKHKGPNRSRMASKMDDMRQMRKHGMSLANC